MIRAAKRQLRSAEYRLRATAESDLLPVGQGALELAFRQLKDKLDERLAREGRVELAQACFDFLPHRARLDLAGWPEEDIFAHV